MRRFISRFSAGLLSLVMLLELTPLQVFADEPQTYTKSFSSVVADRGIAAEITTTDADFSAKLEAADDDALVGTIASVEGSEYQTAKALFEQNYTLTGDFELISWTLTLDGQIVTELPEDTTITYSSYEIVSGTADAKVYTCNSAALSAVNDVAITDFMNLGMIFQASFTMSSLDSTITIANASLTEKEPQAYTKSFSSVVADRGIAAEITTTDADFSAKLEAAADDALVGTIASVEGSEYQTAKALFEQNYTLTGDFELISWTLTLDGQIVTELPEDTTITYSSYEIVSGTADAKVYTCNSAALSAVNDVAITDFMNLGMIFQASFTMSSLDSTITIANASLTEKNPSVTRTYSDGLDLFSVQVTGSADALPNEGTVQTAAVESNTEEMADIQELLEAKYDGELNYSVYNLNLISEGNEITLSDDAQMVVTVRLATIAGDPYIYQYAEGSLEKLTTEKTDAGSTANYSFSTDSLSGIVILNSSGVTVRRFSDFEAGKYRITANLYVKGENNVVLPGVTAYLTNPNVPPVSAMENNAIMDVDEYGNLTFTIDVQNAVFSLQQIADGEDVHIVDSTYGADEGATAGLWGSYTGRIMQLVVTVDNLNGEYAFTNCKEYPTPLEKDVEMPIHLGVDFDSAAKMLDGDGECNTFTDAATGVTVTVQTADNNLVETLNSAILSVTELTEGDSYDTVKEAITEEYVEEPDFKLYDIHLLTAENEEITFTWSEAAEVSIPLPDGVTNGEVCAITDGSVDIIDATVENSVASFDGVTALGQFAVLDMDSIPAWINTTCVDTGTGIILKAYSIDDLTVKDAGLFSKLTKAFVSVLAGRTNDDYYYTAAQQGLKASGGDTLKNPMVEAAYQIAIVHTLAMGMENVDTIFPKEGASWGFWWGKNDAFVKAILPMADADYSYYLIMNDGTDATATLLNAAIEDGMTTIDLMPRSMNQEDGEARLFSLYWGVRKVNPTTTRPISYVVAVKDYVAKKPTAITGLKYTGFELTGVAEGEGYTLTGNTATAVGDYTATATLGEGYIWSDGTTDTLEIKWSIAEKPAGSDTDTETTVTANLYLDGANNQVLPGITVYLNNSSNPIEGTGTPTTPKSNNATLKTTSDGTRTLTLEITNPVFTLQTIGGCSNASVISTQKSSDVIYQGSDSGKYDDRISEITVELEDTSGEYVFEDCVEYPTLLKKEWDYPLVLKVNFEGGKDSGLDSNDNVDTSGIIGNTAVTEEGTTSIVPEVTANKGTAIATVSASDITKAVTQAEKEGATVIEIAPQISGTTTKVVVELPKSSVSSIVSKTDVALKFTTELGVVSIPNDVLSFITEQATGNTISFSVKKKKVADVQDKVDSGKLSNVIIVDVSIISNSKEITSFGGKDIVVNIPTTDSAYTKDSSYSIIVISSDGTVENMTGKCIATSNQKYIQITTSHLTTFVVTTEPLTTLPVTTQVISNPFKDVADGAYYADAVLWAVGKGITSGVSDTEFGTADMCTRAQVVTFLWRAAGSPEPTIRSNPFVDISEDAYYYKAALWAAEKAITKGTSEKTFSPDITVTRAQVVTFQWRMAGSKQMGVENPFTDVSNDSYSYNAVLWAVKNGIAAGRMATTFDPDSGCTRSQIVTFLYRQLGETEKEMA